MCPIHAEDGGYKWGDHGKLYKGPDAKKKAEAQAAAAHAHGYRGDAGMDEQTDKLEARFKELDARRKKLNRDSKEYADLSKDMDDIHKEMEKLRNFKADATEAEVSERIKREYERGHPLKQAEAIAYSELGEPKKDAARLDAAQICALHAGVEELEKRLDRLAHRK